MNYSIGLKWFAKNYRHTCLIGKIETLFLEFRHALQRAWRGYDDSDIYNISENFRLKMIDVLYAFKKNRDYDFFVPKETEHYDDLGKKLQSVEWRIFSTKETDMIIDAMIFHLEMMDEDYVEKKLFGTSVQDNDCKHRTSAEYISISQIMKQNKECFIKLFNLFYEQL